VSSAELGSMMDIYPGGAGAAELSSLRIWEICGMMRLADGRGVVWCSAVYTMPLKLLV
jgi:hypothetical protein